MKYIEINYRVKEITASIDVTMQDIYVAINNDRRENDESRKYDRPMNYNTNDNQTTITFILKPEWIIRYIRDTR